MSNIIRMILIGLFVVLVIALVSFKKQIEIAGIINESPGIVATISPEPNENGWNKTDVTVSFTCNDWLSGIATCSSPVTLTTAAPDHHVSGAAIDHAGNTSSVEITVRIDKNPPDIDRIWRAPCKGGVSPWVRVPPGNQRSSRKQSEQLWR